MELSIVIVNWNSRDYLAGCLRSIEAHARGPGHEVVVIDSGSFDGSAEMTSRDFPWVRFIQSSANLGFAAANNLAAREARGRLLLLLNPDTVVHEGALQALVDAHGSVPRPGILGARLLNTDGSLQTSCVQAFPTLAGELLDWGRLRALTPRARLWGEAALHEDPPRIAGVEMISGACMLLEASLFREVGGFSPEYFMYAEDVDLCLKVQRAGRTNYYVPGARVTHHGGGSSRQVSGFAASMRSESLRRYFRKWHGPGTASVFRFLQGCAATARLAALVVPRAVGSPSARASWDRWRAILRWARGAAVATPGSPAARPPATP